MATTEVVHLLDLWERRICPYCGTHVREGARVVSGDAREGGFCSIRCHGAYYTFELAARADWSVKASPQHVEYRNTT
jgi:ribosomal protein L24E